MAETKTSKVTEAKFLETKTGGTYGDQHIFQIKMENGDAGRYYAKKNPQTAFIVGQEAQYTIDAKENGSFTNYFIKPLQAPFRGAGAAPANEKLANARSALSAAALLVAAGKSGTNKDGKELKTTDIAEAFFNWLEKKS